MEGHVGEPEIVQPAPIAGRRLGDLRHRSQALVQSGRHVEAGIERLHDRSHPVVGKHAAGIDHADHHGLRTSLDALRQIHVGDAAVGLAARQPELTQTPLGAPVDDALRHLGRKLIGHVSEEQQIRLGNIHGATGPWGTRP
jgi:hypothetical protein